VTGSADGGASSERAEIVNFAGEFKSADALSALCNHVADGKKGTGTIEGGAGSPNDLNSFDQVDVEGKFGAPTAPNSRRCR